MALHTKVDGEGLDAQYLSVSPLFAPAEDVASVPKRRMPDGPMAAEMAYEIIHDELMLDGNARLNLGPFELITDGNELPVFAFKLREGVDNYSAFDVSSGMRERGWQVPACSFPENREDLVALRVVVRNGYSRDPADMFLDDLTRVLGRLEKHPSPAHDESYAGFSH